MSNNIGQFNEEIIKGQIKELVRGSVEETLNELLEAEAQKLTQAARYERSEARQGYRRGHHRSPMGQQGVRLHHQRAEQESLCQHRGLAQPRFFSTAWLRALFQ